LEFLGEYDFNMKHIKGKENKVVDALSRRVHEMHVANISMCCLDLKQKTKKMVVVASYQHYTQVAEDLQRGSILLKFKDYKLEEDGILLFRDKVYVPETRELRNMVL
jgi:hypothetical protein